MCASRTLSIDFTESTKTPIYTFTGDWNGRSIKVVTGGMFKAYRRHMVAQMRSAKQATTQLQEVKK